LSMANTPKDSIKTRKVAILAADGVDGTALTGMQQALAAEGAMAKLIAPHGGTIKTAQGEAVKVDFTFLTAGSVLFDAVFVPDGDASVTALKGEAKALHFINEAYNHCKTIGASGAGAELLRASALGGDSSSPNGSLLASDGIVMGASADAGLAANFVRAIAQHRHWSREQRARVPA
jgi:catalase